MNWHGPRHGSRLSGVEVSLPTVQIEAVEQIEGLLATLRETPLRGFEAARPYASASLTLERLDPDDVMPPQNYVLEPGIATVLALREALASWDVDPFALTGAVWVTADGERIPLLPPIVEQSREPGGATVLLVADGMHRVYAARRLGLAITCVVIRGVPAEYPYYAYALTGGWPAVTSFEELPEGHQKKSYRRPLSYKALFRQFNVLYPGVQAQRRQTNPAHLQR